MDFADSSMHFDGSGQASYIVADFVTNIKGCARFLWVSRAPAVPCEHRRAYPAAYSIFENLSRHLCTTIKTSKN